MDSIYFDNAATTQIRDEVIDAMTDVMKNIFGNASSSHSYGRSSKSIVENCRKSIASHFNASSSEIIFTSGGTEADNLALRSAVRDLKVERIITSRIEHHAVLHTAEQLQKEYNLEISFIDVDERGGLDYEQLEAILKIKKNSIVSLMQVNNEIGNLLEIKRVADLCKTYDTLFHSDCVQSVGHFNLDVNQIPIDFFAASAHKFHGPKGVGFAYIRKGTGIKPLIFGGEQERGYRAGTESVHNIVGLERSLKLAYDHLKEESNYIKGLKKYFIEQVSSAIPNVRFNGYSGELDKSTYTPVCFCFS
jgi:cysteine desulfurase